MIDDGGLLRASADGHLDEDEWSPSMPSGWLWLSENEWYEISLLMRRVSVTRRYNLAVMTCYYAVAVYQAKVSSNYHWCIFYTSKFSWNKLCLQVALASRCIYRLASWHTAIVNCSWSLARQDKFNTHGAAAFLTTTRQTNYLHLDKTVSKLNPLPGICTTTCVPTCVPTPWLGVKLWSAVTALDLLKKTPTPTPLLSSSMM